MYEANVSSSTCQIKRIRNSKFGDVNESLYQWCCMATSRNLYPDGPLLMEKAREIAKHLEIPDGVFKASIKWLA